MIYSDGLLFRYLSLILSTAAAPAAGGAAAAPVKEEKPKEEEVDALDGGMVRYH